MTKRIALISSSYHPYPGGVEEHVRNVARELRKLGHEVVVWTVDRGEHLGTRLVDGTAVRYLPTPLPARSIRSLGRFVVAFAGAWRAWRRAFKDFHPDVLHVQCVGPNGLYALALHHRTRIPLLVSSHGETFMDDHAVFESSALLRWGLRRSLSDASAVTGCSSVVIAHLRDDYGLRGGVVVPNGIDLDESPCSVTRPLPDWWPLRGPVILALGRVEHIKGFDLLVRSFAKADLPPDTHLVIGGDGGALASVKQLTADLGVADHVRFPGRLGRDHIAQSMSAASVVVVPSRMEAFGIVALEAWRAGTPLIMTNRGGARDFVTDHVDGVLVDPEQTDELAGALRLVLRDESVSARLGDAGARRVEAFTWRRVAEDYERIFMSLNSETPQSPSVRWT